VEILTLGRVNVARQLAVGAHVAQSRGQVSQPHRVHSHGHEILVLGLADDLRGRSCRAQRNDTNSNNTRGSMAAMTGAGGALHSEMLRIDEDQAKKDFATGENSTLRHREPLTQRSDNCHQGSNS
jgi:hypothetical protein